MSDEIVRLAATYERMDKVNVKEEEYIELFDENDTISIEGEGEMSSSGYNENLRLVLPPDCTDINVVDDDSSDVTIISVEDIVSEKWNKYLQEKKSGKDSKERGSYRKQPSSRSSNTSFRSSRRKKPMMTISEAQKSASILADLNKDGSIQCSDPYYDPSTGISASGNGSELVMDVTYPSTSTSTSHVAMIKTYSSINEEDEEGEELSRITKNNGKRKRGGGERGGKESIKRISSGQISVKFVNSAQKSSISYQKDIIALNRTRCKRKKLKFIYHDIEKISALRTREAKKAVVQYDTGRAKLNDAGKILIQTMNSLICATVEIKDDGGDDGDEKILEICDSTAGNTKSKEKTSLVLVPSRELANLTASLKIYHTEIEHMRKSVHYTSITLHSVLNKSVMNYALASNMKSHSKDLDLEITKKVKNFLLEVPSHVFTDDIQQGSILATSPFQRANWVDGKFGRGASTTATNKQTAYVTKFNYILNKDVPDSTFPRYPS